MAAYAFDTLAGGSGATLVSPGVVSFAPGANRFAYLRAGAPARPRRAYSSTITVALSGTYVGFMTASTSAPNNWVLDDDASSMGAGFDGQPYVFPPAGIPQTITWVHARGVIFVLISVPTGGGTVTIGPATELPAIIEGQPGTIPLPPAPPSITKLIPTAGPDTGGTVVDVVGANLTGATAVDFGGTAGTGLTVDPSGGLATVTTPAHTAGPAPVTITTPAGTSNAETFTFEAPPVVTVPVIYAAYPLYLCADAPDNQQVLMAGIFPITDVVSAEVGGVDVGVVGVLDFDEGGFVVMGAPVLPPGTYDLILTNSAGSSDPYPIEYVDCSGGCPPDPTVVAVFPGAARPGATIQIVGTNLTDATVTMCGDPVAIVNNDGNIITVVVPPGCPDGDTTITVTTPDGETTAGLTVLPASGPTGGPDVIANLVALLAAELGVPVSSRRSPTATKDSDPSVVVRRTGGPSKGVASDNPTVTIEAWAPTTTESFQLLQSARLAVIEAAEQGRAGLRRYDELAGPADLPDPSTTNPRHTLTASVVTRLE